VKIDFTTTPGTDLMMYGDCEVLGPLVAPRFCAESGRVTIAITRRSAHFDLKANFILFTFLYFVFGFAIQTEVWRPSITTTSTEP
jgi:hypothetical protein